MKTNVTFPYRFSTSSRAHSLPMFSDVAPFSMGLPAPETVLIDAPIRAPSRIVLPAAKRTRAAPPAPKPTPSRIKPKRVETKVFPALVSDLEVLENVKALYQFVREHEDDIRANFQNPSPELKLIMRIVMSQAYKYASDYNIRHLIDITEKQLEEFPTTTENFIVYYDEMLQAIEYDLPQEKAPNVALVVDYKTYDAPITDQNVQETIASNKVKSEFRTFAYNFITDLVEQLEPYQDNTNSEFQKVYQALKHYQKEVKTAVDVDEILIKVQTLVVEWNIPYAFEKPEVDTYMDLYNFVNEEDNILDFATANEFQRLVRLAGARSLVYNELSVLNDNTETPEKQIEAYKTAMTKMKQFFVKPTPPSKSNKKSAPFTGDVLGPNSLKHDAFEIIPVKGDGNCFFQAIAYSYLGELKDASARNLRIITAILIEQYARENPYVEDVILAETGMLFDEYVRNIRKPNGQWGGELEFIVLSHYFQSSMWVFENEKSGFVLRNKFGNGSKNVFVMYNGRDHYNALRVREGYTDIVATFVKSRARL